MRPVSAKWQRTVTGSHQIVVEARVVEPGLIGVNPPGTVVEIIDGSVSLDAGADIRSTLHLTVPGEGMWPTSTSDLLAPYGREIHVRRGIRYAAGRTEWVSLGYHRIHAIEQDDAPRGQIRILAYDRMAGIIDARLLSPRSWRSSATYGQVVDDLVREVYPWATIEWDDGTSARTLGRQVVAEEDRYAVLNDLVTSVGKIWYWDHRGVLVIRSVPDPAQPVWTVSHGERGVLVQVGRRLSREGVYNAVVAVGEAVDASAPVRAVAYDDNPLSPTRWGGPFGQVPRIYSSPLLTTRAQAADAARSILQRSLGAPYSVDLTAVPNPALEPHDPVRVRYPGRSEVHVIDRLTIPLVADQAMTGSTREQTGLVIGSAYDLPIG